MESVKRCFESARRKVSLCSCECCRCLKQEQNPELVAESLSTQFEQERRPLVTSNDSTECNEARGANSSGCFPDLSCLRRRRSRRIETRVISDTSEEFDKCSDTDRQLGLEDDEPRPLLRKPPSRAEYKRQLNKELRSLKDKLRYHFANPFHKFRHHKRKPWKLILLFVKIVLVTAQIVLFTQSSFGDAQFFASNFEAFHHLFINGYEPETTTRVYKVDDAFDQLVFTIHQYYLINTTAIGSYDFASKENSDKPPPVTVCFTGFKQGLINSFNWTYKFDPEIVTHCTLTISHGMNDSEIRQALKDHFGKSPFDRLNSIFLVFRIRTVFLNAFHSPDCIQFNVELIIDNSGHNGIATVKLTGDIHSFSCRGEVVKTLDMANFVVYTVLDIVVIILCVVSIILCVRSLIKTYHLAQLSASFFRKYCQRPLRLSEMLGLVNLWFISTIAADIFLIIGSIGKQLVSQKVSTEYLTWSMMLGIGTGLVWTSLLRFLGYFRKYNILLVTMKAAIPSILRFMLCTLILYIAFLICGWAVLGPYNEKFRDLATTSECLFSLLNGDDMYNTFKLTTGTNAAAVIFCQIYLYVFICLFIYVVLNLFIGLISEMYSAVRMMGKKQWKAIYLGKLYHLLDEDEDDDWDEDIIDWHRELQRGRFHSSDSEGSSEEHGCNDQRSTRDLNIAEVI